MLYCVVLILLRNRFVGESSTPCNVIAYVNINNFVTLV